MSRHTTITLRCDTCQSFIAEGSHVREAYDLAQAVGAVTQADTIWCAPCAPKEPSPHTPNR